MSTSDYENSDPKAVWKKASIIHTISDTSMMCDVSRSYCSLSICRTSTERCSVDSLKHICVRYACLGSLSRQHLTPCIMRIPAETPNGYVVNYLHIPTKTWKPQHGSWHKKTDCIRNCTGLIPPQNMLSMTRPGRKQYIRFVVLKFVW